MGKLKKPTWVLVADVLKIRRGARAALTQIFTVSLALTTIWGSAWALDKEALLASARRPSIEQSREAHIDWESAFNVPESPNRGDGLESWLEVMDASAPRLIAALEKTYPGAKWVFMGRDMEAWGDLIEAFYLTLGQRDRVARLGMSKATLVSAAQHPDLLMKMLEGLGLDWKNPSAAHPFILVDTVSKGFGSQGRAVLATVYRSYQKEFQQAPLELVSKVNMMGLIVSTFTATPNPYWEAPKFFEEQRVDLQRYAPEYYDRAVRILTYPLQPLAANEAGYEHFTWAWHGSYGALRTNADGSVSGTPGAVSPQPQRESILWFQDRIWSLVKNRDFWRRTQLAAAALGYEFPRRRPAPGAQLTPLDAAQISPAQLMSWVAANQAPLQLASTRQTLERSLAQGMLDIPRMAAVNEGGELSANGLSANAEELRRKVLSPVATQAMPEQTASSALTVIRAALSSQRISRRDAVWLSMELMSVTLPTAKFTEQLRDWTRNETWPAELMRDLAKIPRLADPLAKNYLALNLQALKAWSDCNGDLTLASEGTAP